MAVGIYLIETTGIAGIFGAGPSGAGTFRPDILEFAEAFVPAARVWVSVEVCSGLSLYGKKRTEKGERQE